MPCSLSHLKLYEEANGSYPVEGSLPKMFDTWPNVNETVG